MVDSATPLGSRGREDVLSAGNLPVVGLPAVTTKVCPLQGLFSYAKRNSVNQRSLSLWRKNSVSSVRDKKIKNKSGRLTVDCRLLTVDIII